MVRVTEYNSGIIKFCCDECRLEVDQPIPTGDDFVAAIDVVCPKCSAHKVLCLLVCKTESKSLELASALEVLKEKRRHDYGD